MLRVFELHKALAVLRIKSFIHVVQREERKVFARALALVNVVQDCATVSESACALQARTKLAKRVRRDGAVDLGLGHAEVSHSVRKRAEVAHIWM
jgi:hypothetical protein